MQRKKSEQMIVKKMITDFIFGTELTMRNGWSKDFKLIGHYYFCGLFDLKGNHLPDIF